MDMHTPGSAGASPPLLRSLVAADPGADADQAAAQELLAALDPRDPAEAQLAAIAIAAAQAAMDNFARAARPGVSDETALRLRAGALAAGRAYASALRYLRRQQTPPAPQPRRAASKTPRAAAPDPPSAQPTAQAAEVPPGFIALQAGATPIPAVFIPHDRLGNEIPPWRRDLMSPAQALAAASYPPDPALVAAAIADEKRMQAAAAPPDARSPPATG